jgi:hypothetical protein
MKKAHTISNRVFVFIDDSFVQRFEIDDDNTWFEEQEVEGGILLKIHHRRPLTEG